MPATEEAFLDEELFPMAFAGIRFCTREDALRTLLSFAGARFCAGPDPFRRSRTVMAGSASMIEASFFCRAFVRPSRSPTSARDGTGVRS